MSRIAAAQEGVELRTLPDEVVLALAREAALVLAGIAETSPH